MKFKQAFSFVADDPNWFKKLLGVIWVIFIPVVGVFVLMGFLTKVIKDVVNHGEEALVPELDFKADLKRGWKLFLLSLVYAIPIVAVSILLGIIDLIFGAIGGDAAAALITISSICFGILIFLYSILLVLILPIAYANFIIKGEFKAGINFKEIFGLFKNAFGAWLMVFLGNLLAQSVSVLGLPSILGGIAFGLYAGLAYNHLIGQAYIKATTPKAGEVVL